MTNWRVLPLEHVAAAIDYGVTASAIGQPRGPKFLRITDIQEGAVDWNRVPWCECSAKVATSAQLRPGDIVFARTGATTGKSFLIRECPSESVFASYLIRVRLKGDVEPRFVSHFFQSAQYWAQITKAARGVAQPGVNATTLKAVKIPVPPASEQRRIADVLDRADALRARRRAALAQFDGLIQAIFRSMFGDSAIQMDWPVIPLNEVVTEFRYGTSVKSGPTGSPVLRIPNVARGTVNLTDLKRVALSPAERARLRLLDGDMLFVRTNGNPEFVGRCAVFESAAVASLGLASTPCVYASYLIRARVRTEQVSPIFIREFLKTAEGRRQLRGRSKTSAGQYNINIAGLGATMVPVPPLRLQQDFCRRADTVEAAKATQVRSCTEFDALFAALKHRAFRGEL